MRRSPGTPATVDVPAARPARPGGVLTALAVATALTVTLAVLLLAPRLDDAAQERRAVVARAEAVSDVLAAGAAVRVVRPVLDEVLADLRAADVPGAGAVARAAEDPDLGSTRGREALAVAVERSAERVEAQVAARAQVARGLLLALYVASGLGWPLWAVRGLRRRRAAERERTAREVEAAGAGRLEALVRHGADVVAVLEPDSTVSFVSPSVQAVLGRQVADVVGRRFAALVMPHERWPLTRLLGSDPSDGGGGVQDLVVRVPHPDGRVLTLEGTVEDLREDPAVSGWVLTARDVSDRHALEDDLAHQAFHDKLTGLPDRQLLGDRLHHALLRREAGRDPLAVLCVDLDDFKVVNDALGHDHGDRLLVVVARRLVGALEPGDTAARLGADEFVVLLDGADATDATRVAEQLLAAIAVPVELDGELHRVRASLGVAVLPQGADAHPHLMRNADVALHEAKGRGGGGLALYDDRVHQRVLDEQQLGSELADAIDRGELVLHFQPTVTLETQTISGFEALVRWQHPERGLVPPHEFIALAEANGLIVPLGAWVLREACRAGAGMQATRAHPGDRGPNIAVNVAPHQLADPDFHAVVLGALADHGLPPERLVLEITETVLLDDLHLGATPDAGIAVLHDLRSLGVRVAIDDFGTGYNSLAQLSALPVDVLKIDKSFVDRLGGGAADSSLVDAIISMSRALGLGTVAEGVEDAEQARWLTDHGATLGQGYAWSRPVPLADALDLLRDGVPDLLDRSPSPAAAGPGPRVEG